MKKAFITLAILAASYTIKAQDKDKLIMDETTVTDLKSNVKIETSETIFPLVLPKVENLLIRYMVNYKKDRKGTYKEYVLYFKLENKEAVLQAFRSVGK